MTPAGNASVSPTEHWPSNAAAACGTARGEAVEVQRTVVRRRSHPGGSWPARRRTRGSATTAMRPASRTSKGSEITTPPAAWARAAGPWRAVDLRVPHRHRWRAFGSGARPPPRHRRSSRCCTSPPIFGHHVFEFPTGGHGRKGKGTFGSGWLVSIQQGTPGMYPSRSGTTVSSALGSSPNPPRRKRSDDSPPANERRVFSTPEDPRPPCRRSRRSRPCSPLDKLQVVRSHSVACVTPKAPEGDAESDSAA